MQPINYALPPSKLGDRILGTYEAVKGEEQRQKLLGEQQEALRQRSQKQKLANAIVSRVLGAPSDQQGQMLGAPSDQQGIGQAQQPAMPTNTDLLHLLSVVDPRQAQSMRQMMEQDRKNASSKIANLALAGREMLRSGDVKGFQNLVSRNAEFIDSHNDSGINAKNILQQVQQDPKQVENTLGSIALFHGAKMADVKGPAPQISQYRDVQGRPVLLDRITGRTRVLEDAPLAASTAPQVNIATKQESSTESELGKRAADYYFDKVIPASDAARETINEVNSLRAVGLENTDAFTASKGRLASYFDAFGLDGKAITGVDPSKVQQANQIVKTAVNKILSQSKGVQTDADAVRAVQQGFQITNTGEANDFILATQQAMAERDMDRQEFFEQYKDKEGKGTFYGAQSAWDRYAKERPIVLKGANGKPAFYPEIRAKAMKQGISPADFDKSWREESRKQGVLY